MQNSATMPKQFYSYLFLRQDGTPYYAGKGSGDRAFYRYNRHCGVPKDKSLILIFPMLNEEEALESEIALIQLFGRKDNGTGILRNFTDGGDGVSGLKHSEESKRKNAEGHKGLKHTEEWKQAARTRMLGNKFAAGNKGNVGTKRSVESRRKMSEAAKRFAATPEGFARSSAAGKLGSAARWQKVA